MRAIGPGRFLAILTTLFASISSTANIAAQRWDVEVHGGGMISSNPTAGTTDLPAGSTVTLPLPPGVPSPSFQVVPSWYFGDGAALIDRIVAPRFAAGIIPLDPVLQSRFVERRPGSTVGLRIARSLSERFGVEFSFDEAFGSLSIPSDRSSRIKASEASFLTTWNPVLSGVAGGAQLVTADATISDRRGRQMLTTGAVLISVARHASVEPYLTLGAGIISTTGAAPSAVISGHYHFNVAAAPISSPMLTVDQTDTVTARAVSPRTMTWLVGGGVKYALTRHWGVRADIRDHVHRDPLRTIIDVAPVTVSSGSTGALTIVIAPSTPGLQFSTSPSGPSTLGGIPIVGFKTFTGTGIVNQVNVAAGLYWRF